MAPLAGTLLLNTESGAGSVIGLVEVLDKTGEEHGVICGPHQHSRSQFDQAK